MHDIENIIFLNLRIICKSHIIMVLSEVGFCDSNYFCRSWMLSFFKLFVFCMVMKKKSEKFWVLPSVLPLHVIFFIFLLYHINIAPFSCDTRSKALYIYCWSHKGTGASSTRADTAWSDQRDRLRESPQKGERDIRYRHVWRCGMRLALVWNRQPGSFMCPVYSTDTQLPGSFNQ